MNIGGTQPEGIDEATLLAFVESVMPVERASALRNELGAGSADQKHLLRQLDAMRRDRAGVASLAVCPMPAGMVEAAMRQAQQEALSGLRLVGEQTEEIPVSRVVPRRHSRWTAARRLMTAAAVVGVVGGVGLVTLWPKAATRTTTDSGGPIAINSSNSKSANDSTNSVTPAGRGTTETSATDPDAPPPVLPEGAKTLVATADAGSASGGAAAVVPFAATPAASAGRAARVLELAKSGRLVIKVTARTPRQSEQQFASLASKPQGSRVWDVSADVSGHILASLAALSPEPTSSSDRAPDSRTPGLLPHVAGTSSSPVPMIFRPEPPLPMVIPPAAQDLVGIVHVVPTLDGIEAVRRALTDAVGSVTVAELSEPLAGMGVGLDTTEGLPGVVTIDSALWWAGPPTRWAAWASVPVIVER